MLAHFDRFTIQMTRTQAETAAHPGPCDYDVAELALHPRMVQQFRKIDPDAVRAELKEYGAWDEDELSDNDANIRRIIWIAADDILHPNG